jgi:hypothetical protein
LIQYLIEFERMSFPAACRQVGRDLPEQQEGRTPQSKRPSGENWKPEAPAEPVEAWCEHAAKFVTWCHEQLLEAGDGEDSPLGYLQRRGITRESAIRFRLGWNPGQKGKDQYRAREAWGLETLLKPDNKPKKLWLPIGLVIPRMIGDKVLRIRIRIPEARRTVDFSTPYYVVPGSNAETFVVESTTGAYFIIEAELDGILVAQEAGDLTGVMAMGNSSAHPTESAHRLLIDALHIANALDYDPDVDGKGNYVNPGGKGWLWWKKHYAHAERWPVPVGKDPGDAFKAGCNIRDWVKEGLPPIFAMHRPAKGKKEAAVQFDVNKAYQALKDSTSRIENSFDLAAWTWLQSNRPDIIGYIVKKRGEIDGFFVREDMSGLNRALELLEEAHQRAWAVYAERPPVIDVDQKDEKGDCHAG